MSEKKEFETLLAALGERDLSAAEQARMWELIEKKEERLDEYLTARQMTFALRDLNLTLVSTDKQPAKNSAESSRKNYPLLIAVAAALLVSGLIFWLNENRPSVQSTKVTDEKTANEIHRSPLDSSEEEYRKKMEQLPTAGSLKRPPTEFSSLHNDDNKIDFARDIQPIIADNCISCHGPDAKKREADLRMDTYEGLLSENTVVPGKPEKSELIHRIYTDDEDDIMPPPDSHKTLTQEQKELLKQWIKDGAPWQKHWAYSKVERPAVKLQKGTNPIDHFIEAGLKKAGLKLNDPAGRYELARRAAFDLTGLPPEPKILSEFIVDQSSGAYERFLDKLLKSPEYAEHMARYWLDAARYGDTHGMHLDNYREIWPYRDWVIKAFNDNMPFDRFTVEQLAGDLLPNATDQQRIATGFNRCNVTTSEGGSIPEEVSVRYMSDRVETASTVFLGLTTGCAACHDHKFDPISQQEFYQLGAFFNNTTQPAMDGNRKDSAPVLTIPTQTNKKEWAQLKNTRKAAFEALDKAIKNKQAVTKWWAETKGSGLKDPVRKGGLIFEILGDNGSHINGKKIELKISKKNKADELHPAGQAAGVRFADKTPINLDNQVEINAEEPFTVSLWIRSPDIVRNANVLEIGAGKHNLTVKLDYQGGVKAELKLPGGSLDANAAAEMALTPRSWQHMTVSYSGGQSNTSLKITHNGEEKGLRILSEKYIKPGKILGKIKLGKDFNTGGLSHVRFYNRVLSDNEISLLAAEFDFKRLIKSGKSYSWKELNDNQRELLALYHLTRVNEAAVKAADLISQTQKRRDFIYSRSTTTLIMEEKSDTMPTAYVLERGEYDKKKERVTPNIPKVFSPMAPDLPRNRLGLARWLIDRDNPLTSRVTVNRLWQNVFGAGLVKTSEDFGIMGSPPTHPKLLDWLAVEFMDSGWDVRHMLKLMLTSKAYKQSAVSSEAALKKDPDNKLLSRGPRFRLDAEELRDQALSVSGLLNKEIGGPSVKPYQPAGLWKVVAFAGSNTKDFKADTGTKLYRRSLYTFWKRTSPPPSMAAFDAPTRENCTVRRERTNTPLQALVLMNDTQYIEAARHLAQRSIKEKSIELERLQWLFQSVLGKPAVDIDISDLSEAVTSFRKHFSDSPEVAAKLIKTGESPLDPEIDPKELASWTMIVNILMNRDDFINN